MNAYTALCGPISSIALLHMESVLNPLLSEILRLAEATDAEEKFLYGIGGLVAVCLREEPLTQDSFRRAFEAHQQQASSLRSTFGPKITFSMKTEYIPGKRLYQLTELWLQQQSVWLELLRGPYAASEMEAGTWDHEEEEDGPKPEQKPEQILGFLLSQMVRRSEQPPPEQSN